MKLLVVCFFMCFLYCAMPAFADQYFNRNLYQDFYLSSLDIPEEKEISALLSDRPEERNIILNYLKTIDITKGAVSVIQKEMFDRALLNLEKATRDKVAAQVNAFLGAKNYIITVMDINSPEYFLKILFVNSTQ